MQNFKLILILALLYWNLQGTGIAEEGVINKMVKEIPMEIQLFKTETLGNIPGVEDKVGYFIWPSAEQISIHLRQSDEPLSVAEKKMVIPKRISVKKETVTEAKRMAEKWVRVVLQDRWIPIDIYDRLIALDSDIDGYDTIRLRYEIDGYYIQISQTNPNIAITIKSISQEKTQIPEIIGLFLNESEKIKGTSLTQVETFSGGMRGKPDQTRIEGASNQWWGFTYWWTDGEAMAFFISKFYGGAGIPFGLPKDWF